MKKFFGMKFEVTETCDNGNERTIKKTVYVPRFNDHTFNSEMNRIKRCEELLSERGYYKIQYLNTVVSDIIIDCE